VPTIKDSTWAVKPPAGALEAGALCPDGLGLLTVVVEEGDERGRPTVLNNGTTCAPGGNGGAVLGNGSPETDANVAPILPHLGPIGGIGVNHDGVTITAEKECGRVKGRKGRARKAKRGFLKEAHLLDGGSLVSGAAQEGRVVFLKELVAVVAREEASSLAGEAGEPRYTKPVERKRERPQNRYPDQLGRRRTAGIGREALVVMAAASRWRYARVPAGHPRMMQPSRLMGKEESPLGGRIVSGETRNRHLSRERDIPAEAKMRMVSWATSSAMRPSTKRPVSSM
jgi:hypothetical protein